MKKTAFYFVCVIILTGISQVQLSAQQLGDVNSSGAIDIVDALLIAQYYVGLNPSVFVATNADVNCSGVIDIIDALVVAQYYVGLVSGFTACTTPPTPVPTITPTVVPTTLPTPVPTVTPSIEPTPEPTAIPTAGPSETPSSEPSPTVTAPPLPTGFLTTSPNPSQTPVGDPSPGTLSGDCIMWSGTLNVTRGDEFIVSILCNTGVLKLGQYEFSIAYDPTLIGINTALGMSGVTAGSDGFVSSVDISSPGTIITSGTDPIGRGPGASIEVCTIHFIARNRGSINTTLTVKKLADETGTSFPATRTFGFTGYIVNGLYFCDISPSIGDVPFETGPVFIRTITCNDILSAYDFQVTYDPDMLQLDTRNGVDNAVTDLAGFTVSVDATTRGIARIKGTSSAPRSIFNLCSIKFIALSTGSTRIGLDVVALTDGSGTTVSDPRGFGADANVKQMLLYDESNGCTELIWNGSDYSLLWLTSRKYISEDASIIASTYSPYLYRFDREGNTVANRVCLDQEPYARYINGKNIVWNGFQYAFAWIGAADSTCDSEHLSLMFETIDPAGTIKKKTVLEENKRIYTGSQSLGIAWTGSDYLVTWRIESPYGSGNYDVYLTRVDADGNRLQENVLLGNKRVSTSPNIPTFKSTIWTGTEFKYLYTIDRTSDPYMGFYTYALTTDRYGNIKSDVQFNIDWNSYHLKAIDWINDEYACVVYDSSYRFARIDASGNIVTVGPDALATATTENETSYFQFSVIQAGDRYAICWVNSTDDAFGNAESIKIYEVNTAGEILYRNENIKDTVTHGYTPIMAWTGSEFGIAFKDFRIINAEGKTSAIEIFYSRLDAQAVKIGTDIVLQGVIDP